MSISLRNIVMGIALSVFMYSQATASDDALREQARAGTKALGGALKQELQKAIQTGGPVAAIEVCNEKAPRIAATLSDEKQMTIGRTALRVRNPNNAPDAWEKTQLEAFNKRLLAGEPVETMETHTIQNGTFRYMKAIPMQAMCASCHGDTSQMPETLKKRIAALYPNDQATGFSPADVRGAFTVSIPVAPAH